MSMPPPSSEDRDEEQQIIHDLTEASKLIEKCIVTTVLMGPRERVGRLYHLSLGMHSLMQAMME